MVWDLWYFENLEEKDDLISELIISMMEVFLEQPRLHRVC